MDKKFPLPILAFLVVLIGVVNALAEYRHLYFYIWWLDIPMHLVGGCWVGLTLLTYYFSYQKKYTVRRDVQSVFFIALTGTLIVALGWELFEWETDRLNGLIHFDLLDTISDICNGVIGAAIGATVFVRRGYNWLT